MAGRFPSRDDADETEGNKDNEGSETKASGVKTLNGAGTIGRVRLESTDHQSTPEYRFVSFVSSCA
jgi:hypothetical protein